VCTAGKNTNAKSVVGKVSASIVGSETSVRNVGVLRFVCTIESDIIAKTVEVPAFACTARNAAVAVSAEETGSVSTARSSTVALSAVVQVSVRMENNGIAAGSVGGRRPLGGVRLSRAGKCRSRSPRSNHVFASTDCLRPFAGHVRNRVVMTPHGMSAKSVGARVFASTGDSGEGARTAEAVKSVSTGSGGSGAGSVGGESCVSTTREGMIAESAEASPLGDRVRLCQGVSGVWLRLPRLQLWGACLG